MVDRRIAPNRHPQLVTIHEIRNLRVKTSLNADFHLILGLHPSSAQCYKFNVPAQTLPWAGFETLEKTALRYSRNQAV